MAVDCNDSLVAISPNAFETLDNDTDENCNGVDALRMHFTESGFPAFLWPATGAVTRLADGVRVGETTYGSPSSITRTLSLPRQYGGTGVMVDVTSLTSPNCTVALTAGPFSGAGPTTVHTRNIVDAGTRWLDFSTAGVPYVLKKIEIACPANQSVTLDWLSVQDANKKFPAPADLSFDWQDTRAPGGGYTTALVRDDASQWIYMGSDVAGIARFDTATWGPWEVANGTGTSTLFPGGPIGIVDILPMEDGGDDLYVLTGDVDAEGAHGGLWHSADNGDTWSELGTSWEESDPAYVATAPQNDTDDDVAGYTLESNCPGQHFGVSWEDGGGRHLQGDSIGPIFGDVVYIANDDADARGVSIWDGSEICALPNSGVPLPADHVGAILRVDVEPNGTPVLVVGYRGRVNGGAGLYVCELPTFGPSCAGGTAADCWEVTDPLVVPGLDLLAGMDVRDFEFDLYSQEVGETTILIADGGNRPEDADGNGIGDDPCGITDTRLSGLFLDDTFGPVAVIDVVDLADATDMPELDFYSLTGIGMSPGSGYLVANVPPARGVEYYRDRAYRADPADILAGVASWEPLNTGYNTASNVEDSYEAVRHVSDLDLSGAWLEASGNATPQPFPARFAPGTSADTLFLRIPLLDYAVMGAGNNSWLIENLSQAWTDLATDLDTEAEAEGDVNLTFWPDINDDGRHTYQTTVVHEVAIDDDGMIYVAAGDIGLEQMDGTVVFDPFAPNGAQVDCLWNGWTAGAGSISAGSDGEQPWVWLALIDQAVNDGDPYAHNMGILRSGDRGASWEYAAAGWDDGTPQPVMNVDPATGYHYCKDDTTGSATPFAPAFIGASNPAHAFSTMLGALGYEELTTVPSFGNPKEVRGLNYWSAMALFAPYVSGGVTHTEGGLHLTPDGGSTWLPVSFDGDWDGDGPDADDCNAQDTYEHGYFEFVHPGAETTWEGDLTTGAWTGFSFDLMYSVTLGNQAPTEGGAGTPHPCALARITVTDDGFGGIAAADWEWISLTQYNDDDFDGAAPDDPLACGVNGENIARLTVPDWSNEVIFWGDYKRSWSNANPDEVGNKQGGVCSMDLTTHDTTMMVNPRDHEFSIGYVAPHPDVADLYAVLPVMDMGVWLQCYKQRNPVDPDQQRCPDYPWPMIAWRQGSGGYGLKVLDTMPPTARPFHAVWSHIGVPDGPGLVDRGSYLVMGSSGSGGWRGEVTW